MASRRALISKEDLHRMATVCAAENVVIEGEYRGFRFTMSPAKAAPIIGGSSDLDDRLEDWGAL